tara:strand:+ start:14667 stop:15680 length:1014 start_codon:yes stop_codon:yes gene_type:complete
MNVIIPMAGTGSRLRPITPTTPKPLIKLSGKTIIYRIIHELTTYTELKKIGFILNDKNIELETSLKKTISKDFNSTIKVYFFYQKKPEGTAHAIYCAKKLLKGKLLIVFSDTLFFLKKPFYIKQFDDVDGAIFVKEVKDPSSYGVVKLNKIGIIKSFIEKPNKPISNLAIIGVYYFKNAENLKDEISNIISKKIIEKNEYQLTTALRNLMKLGDKFKTVNVDNWLDCGTPQNLLATNKYLLKRQKKDNSSLSNKKNHIIEPVYLGKNIKIKNSKIGPYVSIEDNSVIENSSLKNTIVQSNVTIKNANLNKSIVGKFTDYNPMNKSIILGPFSKFRKK